MAQRFLGRNVVNVQSHYWPLILSEDTDAILNRLYSFAHAFSISLVFEIGFHRVTRLDLNSPNPLASTFQLVNYWVILHPIWGFHF